MCDWKIRIVVPDERHMARSTLSNFVLRLIIGPFLLFPILLLRLLYCFEFSK